MTVGSGPLCCPVAGVPRPRGHRLQAEADGRLNRTPGQGGDPDQQGRKEACWRSSPAPRGGADSVPFANFLFRFPARVIVSWRLRPAREGAAGPAPRGLLLARHSEGGGGGGGAAVFPPGPRCARGGRGPGAPAPLCRPPGWWAGSPGVTDSCRGLLRGGGRPLAGGGGVREERSRSLAGASVGKNAERGSHIPRRLFLK